MIKKIIFDIDDTLIKFPSDYGIWYQKTIDKYHLSITPQELYKALGKYELDDNIRYDKNKMLDTINKELNLNLTMSFLDDYLDDYNNVLSPISEEERKTLEYLSSKYELYTLSNWFTDSQKERLRRVDLLKYFTKVYGTDIVDMKPLESGFRTIIGNTDVSKCVMVGDNQKIDIETPYKMGMHVIHISNNSEYLSAKAVEDIIPLIEKM